MWYDILKQIDIEGFHTFVQSLVLPKNEDINDENTFSSCYEYQYNFHAKYHKELDFNQFQNLVNEPDKNIDKITISMLDLYIDSYVKFLKVEKNEVNDNSKFNDLDLEDDGIENNEVENIMDLTGKTNNLNLEDEKEIESYDESCEENGAPNKKIKKCNYNEDSNSIILWLILIKILISLNEI